MLEDNEVNLKVFPHVQKLITDLYILRQVQLPIDVIFQQRVLGLRSVMIDIARENIIRSEIEI